MEIKSFDQIYGDMRNYIIAHQDKLTDFNGGGVLASQIEATARELAMLYVRCRVGFSSFLRSLPYSVFGFRMREGVKASTSVIFSRAKPLSFDTPLPAGTVVAAGTLKFLTAEAGAVRSGETDSEPVTAVAQSVGDTYNIAAGLVKTIVSTLPADIVGVHNPAPATGGENAEDWASYLDRFSDYILGLQRTNMSGMVTALQNAGLIRSMEIEEHFPPREGIWNLTLYLEDGSGGMTPEALAEAKRIIDGNLAQGIGAYRAPGVNIRYMTPERVPVTLHITVTTERDMVNDVAESVIANEVGATMRNYLNGLQIGKAVLLADLIVVLKRLPSVSNVRIPYPLNDLAIRPDQIARYEDCIVTVLT